MGRRANTAVEVRVMDEAGALSPQHWILIKTHVGQERLARSELKAEGFEVYLPMRLARRIDGSPVALPFFPRYLFAKVTMEVERWQEIFAMRGVREVMGSQGRPIGIRDAFVEGLRKQEVEGYLQIGLVPGVPKCSFRPGDKIAVDGLTPALFERLDGRRVTALVTLLSRDKRVTVDLSRVAHWAGEIAKG